MNTSFPVNIDSVLDRLVGCQLHKCYRYQTSELFCFDLSKKQLSEPAKNPCEHPPILYSLHVQSIIEKYALTENDAVFLDYIQDIHSTDAFNAMVAPLVGKTVRKVSLWKRNTLLLDFDGVRLAFFPYEEEDSEIWRVFPWPNGAYHLVAYPSYIEIENC